MKPIRAELWTTLAAALVPVALTAQGSVAARLDGRVTPDVARAVVSIAAEAAALGLPVEPLVQKAIEGGAKHVPADRVIAAVRALAGRLGEAASGLRTGGIAAPSAEVVEGGADALNAGLSASAVADLAALSGRGHPQDAALMLHVAATLAALGVAPERTVALVRGVIDAGGGANELLDLTANLEKRTLKGELAPEAADEGHGARHAPATRPPKGPPGTPPGHDHHKP